MIAGRYTLGRELGRGGMGAVHLARDEVLGRDVAIKRIGMVPGAASPDLARAEREARLAAMLNHAHVVSVFDLVADQDQHWLVMEYVEGESLADRIRAGGGLDHASAADIMWQVADALVTAHGLGITHRDVKPSNILVTGDGQAKLTDFGIARSAADASLTQTGLVTGSPAYLAPEVATGAGAGPASDVWSLGATLFHVLAGRPPYDVGENLIGGLYKVVHEEPPRLADAGSFDDVLRATMAREPSERWPIERVRDRLAQVRRDPHAVGVTSTASLTSVDASPTTQVLAPVAQRPAPAAPVPVDAQEDEETSRSRWPWLVALAAALAVAVVLALTFLGDDPDEPAPDQPTTGTTSETSPETPATSDPPETPRANTRQDITDFVTTYLATVTSDQQATYAMLTPEFQAESEGFEGYRGYWRTIASATPSNIEVDVERLRVSYDVAYRTVDGETRDDSVTLQLERTGTGSDTAYLIADED